MGWDGGRLIKALSTRRRWPGNAARADASLFRGYGADAAHLTNPSVGTGLASSPRSLPAVVCASRRESARSNRRAPQARRGPEEAMRVQRRIGDLHSAKQLAGCHWPSAGP